jgi:hypothetical protein
MITLRLPAEDLRAGIFAINPSTNHRSSFTRPTKMGVSEEARILIKTAEIKTGVSIKEDGEAVHIS